VTLTQSCEACGDSIAYEYAVGDRSGLCWREACRARRSQARTVRRYRPRWIDHYQSATYRHVETRIGTDGRVWNVFADGTIALSIAYPTEAAMLAAGARDHNEAMTLIEER
jgi:hypothetical protein